MRRLVYATVALFIWSSFQQAAPTRDELIKRTVAAKLDNNRRGFENRCRRDALELASRQADSIILARAFLERDTTDRPVRPARPKAPPAMRPRDSLNLQPLLTDSL